MTPTYARSQPVYPPAAISAQRRRYSPIPVNSLLAAHRRTC